MEFDEPPSDFDFADGESLWKGSSRSINAIAVTWGTTSSSVPLSLGFSYAVEAMVKEAVAEHRQDTLFFPIMFCARHAVELYMKELVYAWARLNGDPVEVLGVHRLDVLWTRAREVLVALWPGGDQTHLDRLGAVIAEMDEVDPDSMHFRYDIDRKGFVRDIPEQLRRVDLVHVHYVIAKVIATFEGSLDHISYLREASDGAY